MCPVCGAFKYNIYCQTKEPCSVFITRSVWEEERECVCFNVCSWVVIISRKRYKEGEFVFVSY